MAPGSAALTLVAYDKWGVEGPPRPVTSESLSAGLTHASMPSTPSYDLPFLKVFPLLPTFYNLCPSCFCRSSQEYPLRLLWQAKLALLETHSLAPPCSGTVASALTRWSSWGFWPSDLQYPIATSLPPPPTHTQTRSVISFSSHPLRMQAAVSAPPPSLLFKNSCVLHGLRGCV